MTYPHGPDDPRDSTNLPEEDDTDQSRLEGIESDVTDNEAEDSFESGDIPELDQETDDSSRSVVLPPPPPPLPGRVSGVGDKDLSSRERLEPSRDTSPLPDLPTLSIRSEALFAGTEDVSHERRRAPVISDDDARAAEPPSFAEYDDSSVLRILGAIVLLGIVIGVLVFSPINILGRDDENGFGLSVQAQNEMPVVSEGLTAVSRLYDLKMDLPLTNENLWRSMKLDF